MPSPPKPWEVSNTTTVNNAETPEVPTRTVDNALNRPIGYNNTAGGYNTNNYNMGSSYGNSYNRYGSGMNTYGGYGGMNSYSGYGGMNSYGMGGMSNYGMGGMNHGMNRYGNRMGDEMSLTQRMEMGTRSTFEVIENIVGSFGGFAQMLDSTFMATHSSFMAMMGIAEQLGSLKNYLGQVFSILALYRVIRRFTHRLTGRAPPAKPMELNFSEFQQFDSKITSASRMSRKPLIIFLLMVVGLPYMMHKLIQSISSNPKFQQPPMVQEALDPSKLEFARATYDFHSESQMELSLKKGDIVAIISKNTDPANPTSPSQWWKGRLRDGTMGLFPANYVEIIQKGKNEEALEVINEAKDTITQKDAVKLI